MIFIFLTVGIVFILAAYMALVYRSLLIRADRIPGGGQASVILSKLSFSLDHLAFHLATGTERLLILFYFYLLEFIRHLVSFMKYLLDRVERKFSRLTTEIRNHESWHQQGSVSLFLQEVKKHRDLFRHKESRQNHSSILH